MDSMKVIREGSADVLVPKESDVKISKEMDVFYNPKMKLNRDITVLLLDSIEDSGLNVADVMAGTGIRSVRLLKELKKGKIESITINDYDPESMMLIKKNLERNGLFDDPRVSVENKDANLLLLSSFGFDYIDIDPFGTPNPFLDASIKKISRGGILAVTATDTAALSGSTPLAGLRKYAAMPRNDWLMHETGLRILARKVQLVGAQYDKALVPILAYPKEHYYRIFFRMVKGKKKVDSLLAQQKHVLVCDRCIDYHVSSENAGVCASCGSGMIAVGPLYCGSLFDAALVKRMKNAVGPDEAAAAGQKEALRLLSVMDDEAELDGHGIVGFFDLHELCESLGISVPRFDDVMAVLKKRGFKVSRTIFSEHSIKTDSAREPIKEILLSLNSD